MDPKYISQFKLDLYKTFETTFWGCPKMIQHSRIDQIILKSSQQPSTSSKYDHILHALLIKLGSWKSAYNSRMTYNVVLWCKLWYKRRPNAPKLQSRTIYILNIWHCSCFAHNHARELKNLIQLRIDNLCWFIMSHLISEMIQSSKTPARNHQHPPSMTVFLKYF